MILLHETIEAGIVSHYIGSADRRWLCDGAANHLSWKIALDLADPEFAREVYDLESQLVRYAELQQKVCLRKWPAVEDQREADRGRPLTKAHDAFATRALFMMAQTYGEDRVRELFREIGRTPRRKVTMKSVEGAFAKVTKANLRKLLRAAERTTITPAPAGAETPSSDAQ